MKKKGVVYLNQLPPKPNKLNFRMYLYKYSENTKKNEF